MDSIYENTDFILSTVPSDENCSQHKGYFAEEQKSESKGSSSKWTKVLLIVLGFSLVFALGGLYALWMIYNHKLADFESLNEQHIMVSEQLAAQEISSTVMIRELEELKTNYTGVREQLLLHVGELAAQEINSRVMIIELEELKTNYTRVREQLHVDMKKEFNNLSMTARYNTLTEWLSFNDAQSCEQSVDGCIACRGKLYLFSSDKLNWSRSRDVCVSKGADLVTITSKSEQDFLVSKISVTHWTGLNDLDTEGHWVWVNNQTLKETGIQFWFNGGTSEPDNWRVQDPSGENCASLGDHNGNFQSWFDVSCKTEKKFICEKKY